MNLPTKRADQDGSEPCEDWCSSSCSRLTRPRRALHLAGLAGDPMNHSASHDPILGTEWDRGCAVCLAARNSTFAQLRTIVPGLGSYDTDGFIQRMQFDGGLPRPCPRRGVRLGSRR